MSNNTQNKTPSLTPQEAQTIIDAFTRFEDSKTTEAEKKALTEFIALKLFTHAAELLGCWQVVTNEYANLIKGFAGLLARSEALLAPPVKKSSLPENVVKLNENDSPN